MLIAPTQWHVHMELTAPFQVSWNHCESIRPVFSVKSLISLLYYLCTIIVAVVTPKLSNTLPDQYWVHLTCHCSICFMYTLLSTWKVVWTHLNTVYSLQQSVSLSCMMSSSLALTGSQPVPQSGASGLLSVANGPSFCSLPPPRGGHACGGLKSSLRLEQSELTISWPQMGGICAGCLGLVNSASVLHSRCVSHWLLILFFALPHTLTFPHQPTGLSFLCFSCVF